MAVIVNTTNPAGLLSAIKKQIKDKKIETWAEENQLFTHSPSQWIHKAWFKASVGTDTLTFFMVPPQGKSIGKQVYAVYHGRFIEMLLAHFDDSFSEVNATALAAAGDSIKPTASIGIKAVL